MNPTSFPFLKKRLLLVTGHYGSGKTEFSVSLALKLVLENMRGDERLALVDLDIVNPYFRSREQSQLLADAGIGVYGGIYKTEITAELPELAADIRAPLEDKHCRVILDVGGNDSGAKVLNQFKKYFTQEAAAVVAVLNFNRFETRDIGRAEAHIRAIENVTGLTVEGIVSNTHLLRETVAETIIHGYRLSTELCEKTGISLWCVCYPEQLVSREQLSGIPAFLMPLGLYMRPTWLDR
ncbi:ATP-binding protein [Oscillospiraceae bacterium CM]|nr:ATP-binding protein [Oscillospiraceae bacterium CM]